MGRRKGVPNKMTTAAKEAIALAAEKLGGAERLFAWAQEDPKNEAAFWTTIYPKLLPLQLTGENGGAIKVERVERVFTRPMLINATNAALQALGNELSELQSVQ
jgi:peptide deformylase